MPILVYYLLTALSCGQELTVLVTERKFQTNFTLPNPTLTNWLDKMTLKHIYVQYSVPTSLVPTYRLVLLPGADCVSYCTQL